MKISIDTTAKVITIESLVKITDLIRELEEMKINLNDYSIEPQCCDPYVYYPQFRDCTNITTT